MPTFNFQPIRLFDPDYCYKFTYLIVNSADPDQFRSQLIWIYTVCKGRVYPGSAGQGLKYYTNTERAKIASWRMRSRQPTQVPSLVKDPLLTCAEEDLTLEKTPTV